MVTRGGKGRGVPACGERLGLTTARAPLFAFAAFIAAAWSATASGRRSRHRSRPRRSKLCFGTPSWPSSAVLCSRRWWPWAVHGHLRNPNTPSPTPSEHTDQPSSPHSEIRSFYDFHGTWYFKNEPIHKKVVKISSVQIFFSPFLSKAVFMLLLNELAKSSDFYPKEI